MRRFKIGFIVNPFAGIGGAVALKGSDGKETRDEALKRGAERKASSRAMQALEQLSEVASQIDWYTAAGELGEQQLKSVGHQAHVVYTPESAQTEAQDTKEALTKLIEQGIDLLLFAGGDGTARDVASVIGDSELPVIGIPAGVKIHSGVYAVTPKAAGKVLAELVSGRLTTLRDADVMDIDEEAFRKGTVRAKRYAELMVPGELEYMQSVKMGGKESSELVLADIAADVIESMDDDALYIMGSGSTVAAIMEDLGLENTLLGVDVIRSQSVVASDVGQKDLEKLVEEHESVYLVITLIGGQGHIFGRGNQQLSPLVIRKVGKSRIVLVATKTKLESLEGRPLIADTGDQTLDEELQGFMPVITGYHDRTMVAVGSET